MKKLIKFIIIILVFNALTIIAQDIKQQKCENLYIFPNVEILEGNNKLSITSRNKILKNSLTDEYKKFIPKLNYYDNIDLQNVNFFNINSYYQGSDERGILFKHEIDINKLKNNTDLCLSSYDFLENNIDLNSINSKNLIIYCSTFKSLDFLENKKNIENLQLIGNTKVKNKNSYPKSRAIAINDQVDNYQLDKNHFLLPKGLTGIKKLFISEGTDFDFKTFSNCPNIEFFALSDSKMNDLTPLNGMPLKSLSINNTLLKNIKGIEKFPLQELSLFKTKVSSFAPLKNLNKLQKLRLSLKAEDNFAMDYLKNMSLETLIITIEQKKIRPPKELFDRSLSREERQRIHKEYSEKLRNRPKKNISLAALKNKPIKKLYLSNITGHIKNIEVLKTLPLEELYLSVKKLSTSDIKVIANIPTLKKLALVKCNLTNRDLLKILKKGNIISLNVNGNSQLNNLLTITLSGNKLEYLYIGNTSINHISNITKLTQLKVLEISNLKLSNLSKKIIDYKMKKNPFAILKDVGNIKLLYF